MNQKIFSKKAFEVSYIEARILLRSVDIVKDDIITLIYYTFDSTPSRYLTVIDYLCLPFYSRSITSSN